MGKKAVSKLFYYTSVALTFALAGVTITGAFAGHVPPESSTLLPFLGLLLSCLLLITLAAAIYWGIRRRFWIVIPLIAIAANWKYLGRIFQPPFPAEKEGGKTLKIATYNVDSFGNEQSGYSCKEIANTWKSIKWTSSVCNTLPLTDISPQTAYETLLQTGNTSLSRKLRTASPSCR